MTGFLNKAGQIAFLYKKNHETANKSTHSRNVLISFDANAIDKPVPLLLIMCISEVQTEQFNGKENGPAVPD